MKDLRKQLLLGTMISAALILVNGVEKKIKLDTDTQKASYVIGQQIGTN